MFWNITLASIGALPFLYVIVICKCRISILSSLLKNKKNLSLWNMEISFKSVEMLVKS